MFNNCFRFSIFIFLFSKEKEKKKLCFQNEKHVWLVVFKGNLFDSCFWKSWILFSLVNFFKKIIFILIQKHVCSKVFKILTPKETINQLFCI